MTGPIRLVCLAISQPIGTLYVTSMTAGELIRRVAIYRRGLAPAEQTYVQRQLTGRRAKEIADYVGDPDATFPTSIIVAADQTRVHPVTINGTSYLVFGRKSEQALAGADSDLETRDETATDELALTAADPNQLVALADDEKIGEVIDGQHRLEGLKLAGAATKGSLVAEFELPVVFMLDMQPEERAYVFSIINSKQTRVPSSLIFDLFGLAQYRSPRRTCHEIARTMNAKEGGPFFETLKMLGKKTLPTQSLTQGSFAKYVLTLISRTPDEDERALKLGKPLHPDPRCPLRRFFQEERDDMVAKILENYFSAISEVYPTAWSEPDNYALRRTVGFAALIKAFQTVWFSEIAASGKGTLDALRPVAERFKAAVSEDDLRNIPSSEGGANDLARRLTRSWVASSERGIR